MQYLSFHSWLISLNKFSKFIHAVTFIRLGWTSDLYRISVLKSRLVNNTSYSVLLVIIFLFVCHLCLSYDPVSWYFFPFKSLHSLFDVLICSILIFLRILALLPGLNECQLSLKMLFPCNLEFMLFVFFGLIHSEYWVNGWVQLSFHSPVLHLNQYSSALTLKSHSSEGLHDICVCHSPLYLCYHLLTSWLLAHIPIYMAYNLIYAHGFSCLLK